MRDDVERTLQVLQEERNVSTQLDNADPNERQRENTGWGDIFLLERIQHHKYPFRYKLGREYFGKEESDTREARYALMHIPHFTANVD